ncbi:hypothetical protein FHT67_004675 [Paenibacillus sp. BK720]|nr:hypothetical protein [Paenibacillus sp. BK720]
MQLPLNELLLIKLYAIYLGKSNTDFFFFDTFQRRCYNTITQLICIQFI